MNEGSGRCQVFFVSVRGKMLGRGVRFGGEAYVSGRKGALVDGCFLCAEIGRGEERVLRGSILIGRPSWAL